MGFYSAGDQLDMTTRADVQPRATTYRATDDVSTAIEEAVASDTPGAEGCRVLSYLPSGMLSFTWN